MQIRLEEGLQRNYENYVNYKKLQNFESPSTKIDEKMQITLEEDPQRNYENYENCEYYKILKAPLRKSFVCNQGLKCLYGLQGFYRIGIGW